MPTILLTIAYDGTNYSGWQVQPNGLAVQQVVEGALEQLLGERVRLCSSGRTDAGVHARAMPAAFATSRELPLRAFIEGTNRYLPDDVAIQDARLVPDGFKPISEALAKQYRYTIYNSPHRSPLDRLYSWQLRDPLDVHAMIGAAGYFVGTHDFAAFRASNCVAKTTVRRIDSVEINQVASRITIDVVGEGFLKYMVRVMAGTLVDVGDALLRTLAERFEQVLHADDLLARLDSDEFAILLPRPRNSREIAGREAMAVAEKLHGALHEPIEMDGETIHVRASIGITLLPETLHETATEVLRQADMAMSRAKIEGGNRIVFFEAEMGASIRERFQLEAELRAAIVENQLRLYLQPQVNAHGVQVGAEALVRWQHPARGVLPPGLFVPLAETSELIVALDRWMLAAVCRLLAQLDAEGRSLRISVNISPRHFQQADFVEEIKRQLRTSGADPCHLVLELTEGIVIGDIGDVIAKMTTLSTLGIHFSIDDFGTGYSSLAYIKRLPIHELKIDKSFIQDATTDPDDAALVETILAIAQHLHFQIVAEGVETQEQADFLNARASVIHQGYLYGRPEPVETWQQKLDSAKK